MLVSIYARNINIGSILYPTGLSVSMPTTHSLNYCSFIIFISVDKALLISCFSSAMFWLQVLRPFFYMYIHWIKMTLIEFHKRTVVNCSAVHWFISIWGELTSFTFSFLIWAITKWNVLNLPIMILDFSISSGLVSFALCTQKLCY